MQTLLEKISSLRLLVIGDIMLDRYLWGDVSRISPEAPVPVVQAQRDTYAPGGGANVALNLRAIGCQVNLIGRIGEDPEGKTLASLLREAEIGFPSENLPPAPLTIRKTRVMVRNQQLCRIDREDKPESYDLTNPALQEVLRDQVRNCDAVILSDYGKGTITSSLIDFLQSIDPLPFIALDPKPRRKLVHRNMDLLTPNRTEAMQLAGIESEGEEPFPAPEVCRNIRERHQPKYIAITLGAEGMLLCQSGEKFERIPTYAREVFDVSGAGDTVIACMAAALAAGADFRSAAELANRAAGIVVGKVGTATASPREILDQTPE